MKYNFIFILVLLLCSKSIINAQESSWKKGYVITNTNDTVFGKIKLKNKPPGYKLKMRDSSGKLRMFEAHKTKCFIVGDRIFESHYSFPAYYYFEKRLSGYISIYEYKGREYIKKSEDNIEKVNNSIFFTIIQEYVKDYKELYNQIKNRELKSYKLEDIVIKYNDWAIENITILHNEIDKPENQIDSIVSNSEIDSMVYPSIISDTIISVNPKIKNKGQKVFIPRINYLGFGISLETKISDKISIYLEGGSGFSFYGSNYSEFSFSPYIKVQPRFFTDIDKRSVNNKNIDYYSANYISPYFIYIICPDEVKSVIVGPAFGIQRKKGEDFYWGVDMGFGIRNYIDSDFVEPVLIFNFNFGKTL